jgi:hypothetical protein
MHKTARELIAFSKRTVRFAVQRGFAPAMLLDAEQSFIE